MSKTRIAILISLLLAMPAAVVALEQAAPSFTPTAAEPQATETAGTAPVTQTGEPAQAVEQPVVGFVRATQSDTFPQSDGDYKRMPAEIAYYEQVERGRAQLVARGDSFPAGSLGFGYEESIPAAVVYAELSERARMAGAQPEAQAPVQAAAAESRNPFKTAADYVTGLFKSKDATAN